VQISENDAITERRAYPHTRARARAYWGGSNLIIHTTGRFLAAC